MEVKDVNVGNWILDPYLRHSEVRRIELVAEGSFIWVLVVKWLDLFLKH